MKMKIRVLPVLFNFHTLFNEIPSNITFGFAAFLHFMRSNKQDGNKYYGVYQGREYLITDDSAAYFYEQTQALNESEYPKTVLSDVTFWGTDLDALPGFINAVNNDYQQILEKGITVALKNLNQ